MRWFRSSTRIVPQANADALQRPPHHDSVKTVLGSFLRNRLSSQFALAAFMFVAMAAPAYGTVTINGITGVSATEGFVTESTTVTTTPTVYGGLAGAFTCSDDTVPCPNCTNPGLTGDNNLVACNDLRIGPNVLVTITFTTDTANLPATAKTALTDDTGATLVTGFVSVPVTSGNQATVAIRWRDLCVAIGSDATCSTASSVSKSLKVGVDTDGDGSLNDATDEAKQISFNLVNVPNASTAPYVSLGGDCTATNLAGICHFSVFPGDEKIILRDLRGLNGFPNSQTIPFKKLRVFFTTAGFDTINPTTQKEDLVIEGSGDAISVSPKQVTGVTNEQDYNVKVAVVDAAGNVGYYTAAAQDAYCDFASPPNNACHTVRPGEVVGVLAKDMNCFIATAAYGSKLAPQVETFRRFRDRFLKPTSLGASFVEFYYEHSPKYAHMIAESETLRTFSRVALWPLLFYAWLSLKVGFETALLLCATIALLPFLAVRAMKSSKLLRGSQRA